MKRFIVLIMIVLSVFAFASCGQSSSVDFDSLKENMTTADKALPEMKEISSESDKAETLFKSLSDFDYSKVEKFFLYYSADGSPYEIAAVQLKNTDDVKECESSLKKHIDSRIQLYGNYAPENVKQAEKAKVITKDNIAALIMCDNRDSVEKAFLKSFKS